MIPQFVNLTNQGVWSVPKGVLNVSLTVFVIACVLALLLIAASRWVAIVSGMIPARPVLQTAASSADYLAPPGELLTNDEKPPAAEGFEDPQSKLPSPPGEPAP